MQGITCSAASHIRAARVCSVRFSPISRLRATVSVATLLARRPRGHCVAVAAAAATAFDGFAAPPKHIQIFDEFARKASELFSAHVVPLVLSACGAVFATLVHLNAVALPASIPPLYPLAGTAVLAVVSLLSAIWGMSQLKTAQETMKSDYVSKSTGVEKELLDSRNQCEELAKQVQSALLTMSRAEQDHNTQLTALRSKLKEAEANCESAATALETEKQRSREVITHNTDIEKRLHEAESRVKQLEQDVETQSKLKADMNSLLAECEGAKKEAAQARASLADAARDVALSQQQAAASQAQLDNARAELEAVKAEVKALEAKQAELQAKREELDGTRAELEAAQAELRDMQDKQARLQARQEELAKLQHETAARAEAPAQQLQEAERTVAQRDDVIAQLRKQLAETAAKAAQAAEAEAKAKALEAKLEATVGAVSAQKRQAEQEAEAGSKELQVQLEQAVQELATTKSQLEKILKEQASQERAEPVLQVNEAGAAAELKALRATLADLSKKKQMDQQENSVLRKIAEQATAEVKGLKLQRTAMLVDSLELRRQMIEVVPPSKMFEEHRTAAIPDKQGEDHWTKVLQEQLVMPMAGGARLANVGIVGVDTGVVACDPAFPAITQAETQALLRALTNSSPIPSFTLGGKKYDAKLEAGRQLLVGRFWNTACIVKRVPGDEELLVVGVCGPFAKPEEFVPIVEAAASNISNMTTL